MATKRAKKIVIIGVGSASFGRGILADLIGDPLTKDIALKLTLVDTDTVALTRMTKLAEIIRAHHSRDNISIEKVASRTKALKGADYVIISVAVRRGDLWEQDFRVPLAYGFKHVLGENGGPGAVFHTLRSLNLLIPICKDVARICPKAQVLNFTNPESRVLMGINYLTKARAVGLCHGQLEARRHLAERILKRPLESLDTIAAGLNHFFWFTKIADAKTGKDLYPLVRERLAKDPRCAPPLVRKMVEVFGCYTYPSDDHIGEYLSFGYEFTGLKWPYGIENRKAGSKDNELPQHAWLDPYVAGQKAPDQQLLNLSGELTIPIIAAIEHNKRTWVPAVNVLNTGGYVANLPTDAVVEVPAVASGRGITPQRVGAIPEPLAAFCRTQISIQKLVIQAYKTHSKHLLLQALLLDPVVNHVGNAKKMLDDMLKLQAEYLPEFK